MPDTSYLAAAYADAYILPIVDGGQGCNHNDNSCIHNSNNKMNVAFQLNNVTTPVQVITTAISVADALESDSNRVNDFWIAYVLAAYQPASDPTQNAGGGQRDDNDPNDPDLQNPQNLQSPLGGVTNGLSGSGALVFIETLRDQDNSYGYVVPSIPRVVAHEIAHQCGLPDRDANQPGIHGLMTFELYNNANIRFNSDDIAMLKARVKSCGVMP